MHAFGSTLVKAPSLYYLTFVFVFVSKHMLMFCYHWDPLCVYAKLYIVRTPKSTL